MPDLEASIFQPYRDRGVFVFGVHRGENQDLLADFAEQTGVSFPLLLDQNTVSLFAYPQGVNYPYPRDVVIGPDLVVRSIKNSFNAEEMEALVEQLLAE